MAKERPIVNIDNKTEIHLEKELFQNEVLRPILKMQHDITLNLFRNHIDNFSKYYLKRMPQLKALTKYLFYRFISS